MAERFLTYRTSDAVAGNIPVDENGVMQPVMISRPGDTLTWDGDITGLTTAGTDAMLLYRVSGLTPSADDMAGGVRVSSENNDGEDFEIMGMDGLFVAANTSDEGCIAIVVGKEAVGIILEGGLVFAKPGIYFTEGVRSFTINGYTGFTEKVLNPAWGMRQGDAVANAAGSTPTADEFNALLISLRNAGFIKG